jgi:hypothetical protein
MRQRKDKERKKPMATEAKQFTLNFEPGLTERHGTLLDCVRERAYSFRNPLKTLAADMDLSESDLSRRLRNDPNDKRSFSICDLERFIVATGDVTPIHYLIEKYLQDPTHKRARALDQLVGLMPTLEALVKAAGRP